MHEQYAKIERQGRNGKFKHKLVTNTACVSDQSEESKETANVATVVGGCWWWLEVERNERMKVETKSESV